MAREPARAHLLAVAEPADGVPSVELRLGASLFHSQPRSARRSRAQTHPAAVAGVAAHWFKHGSCIVHAFVVRRPRGRWVQGRRRRGAVKAYGQCTAERPASPAALCSAPSHFSSIPRLSCQSRFMTSCATSPLLHYLSTSPNQTPQTLDVRCSTSSSRCPSVTQVPDVSNYHVATTWPCALWLRVECVRDC